MSDWGAVEAFQSTDAFADGMASVEIISSKIIARKGTCYHQTQSLRRGLQIAFLIIRIIGRNLRLCAHLRSVESILLQVQAEL